MDDKAYLRETEERLRVLEDEFYELDSRHKEVGELVQVARLYAKMMSERSDAAEIDESGDVSEHQVQTLDFNLNLTVADACARVLRKHGKPMHRKQLYSRIREFGVRSASVTAMTTSMRMNGGGRFTSDGRGNWRLLTTAELRASG